MSKFQISVVHPERRTELINILQDILELNDSSSKYEIDEIYHFFFDDSAFWDAPLSEVGLTLKTRREASVMYSLTLLLDNILNEVGDKETLVFVTHIKWELVQGIVRLALSVLKE